MKIVYDKIRVMLDEDEGFVVVKLVDTKYNVTWDIKAGYYNEFYEKSYHNVGEYIDILCVLYDIEIIETFKFESN